MKPDQSALDLANLTIDYSAAMFIEVASWMMAVLGLAYCVFGVFCGQHYVTKANADHKDRVKERKRIFDEGLRSDALSKQIS